MEHKENTNIDNIKKRKEQIRELLKEKEVLESKIADLLEKEKVRCVEIEQTKDKFLRNCAELENFKKRKEQEKEDFIKFAEEKFIKELIPILDSFDYAVEHAEKEKAHEKKEQIIQGFILIKKKLDSMLEKMGVKQIEAIGKPFDPNLHQAMMKEENKEVASHTVLKEMQRGYQLHDRVLRPSMVIISN